jgi:hypothetical protein
MPQNFDKAVNTRIVGGKLVKKALKPATNSLAPALEEEFKLVFDDVCELLSRGEILRVALARVEASAPLTPQRFRQFVVDIGRNYAVRYEAALAAKAEALVDEALQTAHEARGIGDAAGKKLAVDVFMKQAARLDPKFHEATKIELTGRNGGALQVEADLTLTPAEAYAKMAFGKGV